VKAAEGNARMWEIAERLVAEVAGDPGDWNQALMELGATVCTPREPKCGRCPLAGVCEGRALGIAPDLPVTAAKKAPVEMPRVALVLASASSVLLARRRKGALFGGLWEPPGADVVDEEKKALVGLAKRLGLDAAGVRALRPTGQVEHVLSHRRMRVAVARGALGRRQRWAVPSDEYEAVEVVPLGRLTRYARASLVGKILAVAGWP
jgi:A/G-specific adenine glycosylase